MENKAKESILIQRSLTPSRLKGGISAQTTYVWVVYYEATLDYSLNAPVFRSLFFFGFHSGVQYTTRTYSMSKVVFALIFLPISNQFETFGRLFL